MKIYRHSAMKTLFGSAIIIFLLLINPGCKGKSGKDRGPGSETASASDTGFTGIKKFMSGGHVAMETNFVNGVRQGLTKTFYASGKLRGTMWYENGLKVDSAKWYFEDGQLFRVTPYKRDTVDGIQLQYFKSGPLKAKIGYRKGLRTFEFEEFDKDRRKVGGYPDLVVSTRDNYAKTGTFTISLELSDKSNKVRYYRGDFSNGLFDSAHCDKIKTINGTGTLDLKKTGTQQSGYVDVLASILTFYGNNYLVHKKIELPYKDLN